MYGYNPPRPSEKDIIEGVGSCCRKAIGDATSGKWELTARPATDQFIQHITRLYQTCLYTPRNINKEDIHVIMRKSSPIMYHRRKGWEMEVKFDLLWPALVERLNAQLTGKQQPVQRTPVSIRQLEKQQMDVQQQRVSIVRHVQHSPRVDTTHRARNDPVLSRAIGRCGLAGQVQRVLVILAAPDYDLSPHLLNDVLFIAQRYGDMTYDDTLGMMEDLRRSDQGIQIAHRTQLGGADARSETRVFLIWNPSLSDLHEHLRRVLDSVSGARLEVAYCGHASRDGWLELRDDIYRASCLVDVLMESVGTLHYSEVILRLNCCFALDVAVALLDDDDPDYVRKFYHDTLRRQSQSMGVFPNLQLPEETKLLDQLMHIEDKNPTYSPLVVHGPHISIGLYPMSDSDISAVCAFPRISLSFPTIKLIPARRLAPDSLQSYTGNCPKVPASLQRMFPRECDVELQPVNYHRILCFQAGRGDSTLLLSPNSTYGILIDGGSYYGGEHGKSHAFWYAVKDVDRLGVFLTSTDPDHARGLVSFISMYNTYPQQDLQDKPCLDYLSLVSTQINYPTARGWRDGSVLAKYGQSCDANLWTSAKAGQVITIEEEEEIRVEIMLPDNISIDKAMKRLRLAQHRGGCVTGVNETALALLIEVGGEYLLFTGDADGLAVASALKRSNWDRAQFHYVDLPQHGSYLHEPERFLRVFKKPPRNIVVSSNGHGYGDPCSARIKQLATYLAQNEGVTLHFTYDQRQRYLYCAEINKLERKLKKGYEMVRNVKRDFSVQEMKRLQGDLEAYKRSGTVEGHFKEVLGTGCNTRIVWGPKPGCRHVEIAVP